MKPLPGLRPLLRPALNRQLLSFSATVHAQSQSNKGSSNVNSVSDFLPRPFALLPTHPHTAHIYVLPTANNTLVLHPRLPVPSTPFERSLIVAGFAYRKMRYLLWDQTVAANWFRYFGAGAAAYAAGDTNPNNALKKWVFERGNTMGTRKADDEYFFRGIPLRTDHIEFIYPSSVSLRTLKSQINSYLVDRGSYKRSLFIWTLFVFPPLLLVSKFLLPIMNIVFVYVAFRIAGSWRAMTCANRVQLLLDNGRVKFTQSGDFQRAVREAADIVTQELRREVPGSEESSGTASFSDQSIPAPAVWQWDGKGDLHDEVILNLERDLKMHEWLRTYRRARMMSLIHGHAKQ